MNTEELKKTIAEEDETASTLLFYAMPHASARFHRLSNSMAKLLNEVREHFPDARFYTSGGDGFALVLGETHSGKGETPNTELVASLATKLRVHGGDW
ncbi:hypothetical protein [Kosakonia sacchari]|uniref:hypothetical protein n=1 Tax=Kosakonia sacchari TaxID=1158459 RepID=UPI001585B261|nr:hypothetical protein [Kosakonia sacchari]NUL35089.1 hypothetical protein [Kosakonia sacchari]